MAERTEDGVILNYTRYSLATGKVQEMVTDAVPKERITFVSGINGGYKDSLLAFITDDTALAPESSLMKVQHKRFGEGYVTSIGKDTMECVFSGHSRILMYPDAIEQGLIEVLEDMKQIQ